MADVLDGKRVYVSGKFEGMQKEEVWIYVLGAGIHGVMSKSASDAYVTPDKDDAKLVATGKPLYTLDEVMPSLDTYLERLKAAFEAQRAQLKQWSHTGHVAHLGFGPPADEALIAKIEQAAGELPQDVRALMGQFNGLSCVLATLKGKEPIELPQDGQPLPYAALADSNHPLWGGRVEWLISAVAIPTWEEIFLRPQTQRMSDQSTSHNPKDTIKIGSLKVKAGELFPRLFTFDLFHHFAGAALFLDPKDKQAKIIYGFDYWASLTDAHPVPLRVYMESLVAGVFHRISHAGQRPIKPVSKTAWPTYIRNIHHAPYVFIELK